MVRVNQGELGEEDLAAIASHNPHTVLLPKVEDPSRVGRAAEILCGIAGEDAAFLMPILESPAGIHRAWDIAAADLSVVALTLGLEDLSAELVAPRTTEASESFLARQTTVYAARAAGVQPIASVFSDIEDEDGLAAYVRRERGLGFDGVGCIHPRQIPVVHREMTPSEAESERAVGHYLRKRAGASRSNDRLHRADRIAPAIGNEDVTMTAKMEKNAAGRMVPVEVNGRESVPFKGVGAYRPDGTKAAPRISSCVDYPADGDKRASSLQEALQNVGLRDGMVVSTQ